MTEKDAGVQGTEPWMRGTHTDLDPMRRGLLHALEQAQEDVERWIATLTSVQLVSEPHGLPSVAFHMRHMVRSLDRLLTYAEGQPLTSEQLLLLETEHDQGTPEAIREEFLRSIAAAMRRVEGFAPTIYTEPRGIGRRQLPTTVGGLLVHCAEHTQRHAGQMVTTAKLVRAIL